MGPAEFAARAPDRAATVAASRQSVSADTPKLSESRPNPAAELSAATTAPPSAGPAKTASCVLADSSALPLRSSSSATSLGMIA